MILDQCPHCGVQHVQSQDAFAQALDANDGTRLWRLQRCQNVDCRRLVLIQITNTGEIEKVFPFTNISLDTAAEISAEIRSDFEEAATCLGAGCYKASLVMSRRVLQRCLREQGCTNRNLVDAIDNALESGILRTAFHPLANEIRRYGNLGAHPDDDQLQNANQQSASQVLEFARLLIHEFFEVPATAAGLRRNREQ